ncbi:hypothetical protein PMALA_072740 [Plasmodium malariae]|uniref:Uncharacterized protein n=1 Tax=Plasmodium malariae TaxID=5858 RepID=A0A1A8X3Q5_PLAMA|nr:hypothetical protein PMALA_072740 [Plasmodium malariae]
MSKMKKNMNIIFYLFFLIIFFQEINVSCNGNVKKIKSSLKSGTTNNDSPVQEDKHKLKSENSSAENSIDSSVPENIDENQEKNFVSPFTRDRNKAIKIKGRKLMSKPERSLKGKRLRGSDEEKEGYSLSKKEDVTSLGIPSDHIHVDQEIVHPQGAEENPLQVNGIIEKQKKEEEGEEERAESEGVEERAEGEEVEEDKDEEKKKGLRGEQQKEKIRSGLEKETVKREQEEKDRLQRELEKEGLDKEKKSHLEEEGVPTHKNVDESLIVNPPLFEPFNGAEEDHEVIESDEEQEERSQKEHFESEDKGIEEGEEEEGEELEEHDEIEEGENVSKDASENNISEKESSHENVEVKHDKKEEEKHKKKQFFKNDDEEHMDNLSDHEHVNVDNIVKDPERGVKNFINLLDGDLAVINVIKGQAGNISKTVLHF